MEKIFHKLLLVFFIAIVGDNALASKIESGCTNIERLSDAQPKIKSIDIKVTKRRAWIKNYLLLDHQLGRYIDPAFKKKFDAVLDITYANGAKCKYPAKIRINGDLKDHLSNLPFVSSLDVELKEGNIHSNVVFKLFLPKTRNSDNEIFITELLSTLGFLAPETFYVNASLNNVALTYLFQQKVSKEFLELNKRREGPLIEGDERFFYRERADIFPLGLVRLVNQDWANKGKSSLDISRDAVNMGTAAYLDYFYRYRDDSANNIRSRFLAREQKDIQRIQTYEALLIAAGGSHALGTNNRKFYYDPIYEYLEPIYYDGNVTLLDDPDSFLGRVNNLVTLDQVSGAIRAKKEIESLDLKLFIKKLKKKDVHLADSDIEKIANKLKVNLDILASTKPADNFKKLNALNVKVDKYKLQKAVYATEDDNVFSVCDLNSNNCVRTYFSDNEVSGLMAGNIDTEKSLFAYFGRKSTTKRNPKEGSQIINIGESRLKLLGDFDADVSHQEKKIVLRQNTSDSKALFYGGSLDGWAIEFRGYASAGSVKPSASDQRFDRQLLTACLSFVDLDVNALYIRVVNCALEDALNFIRVHGEIESVNINDSFSDALDADFSNIFFKSVSIVKAGNDCVDFSAGTYTLSNVELSQCGDKAVSAGERSFVDIEAVGIFSATIGIASKDSSVVTLDTFHIENADTCLTAYNKKQEFYGGKIIAKSDACGGRLIQADRYSKIEVIN